VNVSELTANLPLQYRLTSIKNDMQKKILWIGLAFVLGSSLQGNAQNAKQDSTYKKWYVGSSFLMFGNFSKTNNPEYIQLNVGYRITPKDVVSFEFKRSIYSWPIGIPFGPSFEGPGLGYPGHAHTCTYIRISAFFVERSLYIRVCVECL
jgi:hypothetical protein